jgi:hypothetical protein
VEVEAQRLELSWWLSFEAKSQASNGSFSLPTHWFDVGWAALLCSFPLGVTI